MSRSTAGGGARRGGGERRLAFGKRVADRGRHFDRIAVAADMHVEGRRTRAQQVIVDGGDVEAALDHLCHHRFDLGLQQHQIAHRHDFATHGLERDPAAERQRRLDRHAVERHGEIGTRKAVTMDVAGDDGGFRPSASSTFCQSMSWA